MPHDELDGLEVGAYTLERPLGHGGMGSVWLAHRTDGRFEGRVAVKLMNLALVESLAVERFRREGSLLARLTHPGIARLLDAGVAPTRQPYLVIEYIDGLPVDQYASREGLSVPDRLGLVLQVLDALSHAHSNSVVHRDIKPNNILVTPDGTVKLLDFGIGKLLGQDEGGDESLLTAAGGRAFTPAFAAPEQVLGGSITMATDVYSVGVLAYLLVAGRHPMSEPGQPLGSIPALTDTDPARLGLGDLDSVLLKALSRAPADRYQTAQEFADDLRRYLAQRPVSARPDSAAYRTRKFLRRHRNLVIGGTAVAVALIGMAVFSYRQMTAARAQRNAAIRSTQREGALSELQGILASDLPGPDGKPLSMGGRIAKAEEVLSRRYGNDPWLVATVMVDLSGRHFEVGDLAAQRDMLERARVVAKRASLGSPLALADCTRAINFWLLDILDSARADIAEASAALARDPDPDPTVRSVCLEAEGKLLQSAGETDRAVASLEQALAIEQAEPNGGRQLSVENSLAEVLRLSGRTREAVPHFRHILTELEANGYGDTDAWPNVVAFLAASLEELGELAELNGSLREYVRARQGPAGTPIAPRLSLLYGVSFLKLGALDSADWWISKALEDTTGRAGLFAAQVPTVLAQLRLDQGRLADARAEVSKLPTRARGQRATAAMLQARVRRAQGDPQGAARLLELELSKLEGDTLPKLALFTLPLVTAGEWRLARADLRGADSIARLARDAAAIDSLALTQSALVGRAELLRARALAANRELVEARRAAERAVVALDHGYGRDNGLSRAARELVDSLSR
jgi:serine/threonine-protein kinase